MQATLPSVPPLPTLSLGGGSSIFYPPLSYSLPVGPRYRGSSVPGFNAWKNPLRKTEHLSSRLLSHYLP